MLDRRRHDRLRDPHGRWRPRAGGAALVVGLHAVTLAALTFVLGPTPARNVAAQAIEVRLIASPQRQAAAASPLPTVAVSLVRPAAPPLRSIPDFGIEPPAAHPAVAIASTRDHVPRSDVAAMPTDASVPAAAAEPAQIRPVAYARFDPPEPPPLSRRLGASGVVVLRVLIDKSPWRREC